MSSPESKLGKMFDREPPSAIESEMSVLGSMLLEAKAIPIATGILGTGEAFYEERHKVIFECIGDVYSSIGTVDLVLLNQKLADRGQLHFVGGTEYLVKLAQETPTAANVEFHARLVAEKYALRKAADVCSEALFQIYRGQPIGKVVGDLRAELADQFMGAPLGRERARIEFNPVPITELGAAEPPPWVWEGYIAGGHTTLFTALWKSGKTTVLAHVLRDLGVGGGLVGEYRAIKVLVISEESAALWATRREEIGIGPYVHVVLRPFFLKPDHALWRELIQRICMWIEKEKYDLVIFDTIASVWPVVDENDAGQVMSAVMPLSAITRTGAAVVLVHHPKKGDSGEAQASRGSGALPGAVDIIVEMRRYAAEDVNDTRRVLRAYSRFDGTPAEVVLNYGEEGYTVVGGKADVTSADRVAKIVKLLPHEAPGWTPEEVLENWSDGPKPGIRCLEKALLAGTGKNWHRSGAGKKSDGYRYWRAAQFDSRTLIPLGARNESATGNERGGVAA